MTARERRLLKTCARWILTHDIYGHMSREILAEHTSKVNSGAFRVGRTWYRLDMFERYGRYAKSMKE